jgi:hypothetical protein
MAPNRDCQLDVCKGVVYGEVVGQGNDVSWGDIRKDQRLHSHVAQRSSMLHCSRCRVSVGSRSSEQVHDSVKRPHDAATAIISTPKVQPARERRAVELVS